MGVGWMVGYYGFSELILRLKDELSNLKNSSEQVIFDMKPIYEKIVSSNLDEGRIVKYVDFIYLYTSLNDYAEKVDKLFGRINKAYEMETEQRNQKIEKLESAIAEKNSIINKLMVQVVENNPQCSTEQMQELAEEIHRVLNLVENNSKVIATAEIMKRTRKEHAAEANPNFKSYAPNDYIKELYKAGMSCKEIALRFGMTENGIRERLKKLKVYQPRQYRRRGN